MSRSIHETWNQLRKENPTKGEVDKLTPEEPTLKQVLKKSKIKKEKLSKRELNKLLGDE